jgi:HK97 family phage prohead protease
MNRLNNSFEIKSLNGDDGTFEGYGSVFGNIDSHRDIVDKGAFKDSLAAAKSSGKWPKMLLQHASGPLTEDQMPIGIWTRMIEDDYGLYVEGKLAVGTQRGRDVYSLMKMTPRPALDGLSIGYLPKRFTMHRKTDPALRTLRSVNLIEVSLVSSPSNKLATVRQIKSVLPYTADAADNFMRLLAALDKN